MQFHLFPGGHSVLTLLHCVSKYSPHNFIFKQNIIILKDFYKETLKNNCVKMSGFHGECPGGSRFFDNCACFNGNMCYFISQTPLKTAASAYAVSGIFLMLDQHKQ